MKGNAKAKMHKKSDKHHEMDKKAMGGLAKDKEKGMAKKGDKKGSKYK